MILGIEVQTNLYFDFFLHSGDSPTPNIMQFQDKDKVKQVFDKLKDSGFYVNFENPGGLREAQLIGWKYLNDNGEIISLFNNNQIARIINHENLNKYIHILVDKLVEAIEQINFDNTHRSILFRKF